MPRKQQWIWSIGPIGPENEATLSVKLSPSFGRADDTILIDRLDGGLVVISIDEAEHLAQVLPLVVAVARSRQQQPAA